MDAITSTVFSELPRLSLPKKLSSSLNWLFPLRAGDFEFFDELFFPI